MELSATVFQNIIFCIFVFFSFFSLTLCIQVTRRFRHIALEKIIKAKHPPLFWRLVKRVLRVDSFDMVQFFLTGAQQGVRVATILILAFYLFSSFNVATLFSAPLSLLSFVYFLLFAAILSIALISIFDLLPRQLSAKYPESAFRLSLPLTTLTVILFFPFITVALKLSQLISGSKVPLPIPSSRDQLMTLMDELDETQTITDTDKRLIQSVFNFKERIAREIMRPRVNAFCLPVSQSLQEAASHMQKEGYSRVPVYKDTIDDIIGVVYYKDLLSAYVRAKESEDTTRLHESIAPYVKKVHFCPETKKISALLQEFRKKQIHLAVVVDEYGGTSGIVTIEDILEEIVGEIADEYDDIETYSQKIDDKHWIIDARVNILDLEEETGIKIPQEGEYDTVAGYVYYRLRSIPVVGYVLHHDEFDMKIIACNDRMVEKVEIELHDKPQETSWASEEESEKE